MVLSIMANSTQNQEKNATDTNAISEEMCSPEKEEIEARGETESNPEVQPNVKTENESVEETVGDVGREQSEVVEEKKELKHEEKGEEPEVIEKEEVKNNEDTEVSIKEEVKEEKVIEKVKEGMENKDKLEKVEEKEEVKHKEEEKGEFNDVEGEKGEFIDVEGEKEEFKDVEEKGELYEDKNGKKEDRGEEEDDEDEYEDADDEEVELEDEKVPDGKPEKPLDHDQDRRNPQYIPKGGAFYEHDNRTSLEDVENKDPQEVEKKKKVWKESKESERWLHDWYKESEQTPKSKAEIIQIYGYDIRNEEAPPRARRRRKYGRGPDKYERNWEDEQAYMVKQNGPGRRGKKKSFGKEEFPPLPNQRNSNGNPARNDSNVEKIPQKSLTWKRTEEEPPRNKSPKGYNQDRQQISGGSGGGGGSGQFSRSEQTSHRNNNQGSYTNKKVPPPTPPQSGRKINDEDIKPFRNDKNKWKRTNFTRGKQEEIPKPNKTRPGRQGEGQTPRNVDSNRNSSGDASDMSHLTEGFCQMTFHNKHSSVRERQETNEIVEQEMDSPANRLNPKRYSKNRKSFTGFFPSEDIVEIDPTEMKQLQQDQQQQKNQHVNIPQQPLNIQSVIRRYPGTYNGNPGYMATRPIITGIPNQGVSPQGLQQALSPQGIPQQALSPQVPALQTIELQQGPLPPQPNFVPPMYIDMDPHYGPSEMMGPFTGYAPYSASQPGEMYQPSGGITYYNTECQNSNQIRAPPARRQKAAIPIVPPPE